MTHTFQDLVVGGVLVAPIVFYGLAALAIMIVLRPLLHFVGFSAYVSNTAVAELGLYVAIFGLITLAF